MSPEHRKVEALLAMGRANEAAAMVERLPSRDHPTVEFYRLRGRALRAAGRVFDAEAAYRDALAMAPQEAGVLADLATTLFAQRRLKEALPYAREAVSLRPDVAAWHCLVGVIAEALELDGEAETALSTARSLSPGDAATHAVYGWHLLRTHRPDAAEAAFRDALAAEPATVEALRGLARVALYRQDWASARHFWLETLALDPRQKDRQLVAVLLLGHPIAAPLRLAIRIPLAVSVGLAVAAVALIYFWPLAGQAGAIVLLLLASLGPACRILVSGGQRE